MIAVTFALPNESSDFVRLLRPPDRFPGKQIRVLHTGVGETTTRARLREFLKEEKPGLLISSGFAGAITNQLEVGSILLAENFSNPALLEPCAAALGAKNFRRGNLATAHHVIDSAADRETLARGSGAVAVDMETEFIAQACADSAVPMISIRAISDSPTAPFPIPSAVLFNLARQKTEYVRLASYLLTHPGAVPHMVKFAGNISRARRSLTDALELILRSDIAQAL
jgi:hypothetical protein